MQRETYGLDDPIAYGPETLLLQSQKPDARSVFPMVELRAVTQADTKGVQMAKVRRTAAKPESCAASDRHLEWGDRKPVPIKKRVRTS